MSKRHGGRQNRSYGGSAGGGRGGGGGGKGGGRGGGRGGGKGPGKISYDAGDEPAFIRQFKERTGYKAPSTTDDKRSLLGNDNDERPRDGDYRKDDEKPQIVQLSASDLTKEEVEIELTKVKEAEEEKKCIDSTGRLLFRKPKEKSEESDATTSKSEIIEMASNKINKRKQTTPSITTTQKETNDDHMNQTTKKTKTQLLSFMDESGFDGDD